MNKKNNYKYAPVIEFIRSLYKTSSFIPLHEPKFLGNEKKYINECIDSTFVSSVGNFVNSFEKSIESYTGAKHAIATCNGTAALHAALLVSEVGAGDEIITQPLTFVATCNAINYCNASPIFIDVDKDTMGLSPKSLSKFLSKNAIVVNNECVNKETNKVIRACIPMHTFGHPCRIEEIRLICKKWKIALIEDSAESLGSFFHNKHAGTYGDIGILSFNGNKIITAGGGGCVITDDSDIAKKIKHITTTAKIPHKWEYSHDMVGYNYRMPNLNAALILAQMEQLDFFLKKKRDLAANYDCFFSKINNIEFVKEPKFAKSNYWLNTVILEDKINRDYFLEETNSNNIMTRPAWTLMNKLKIFQGAKCQDLSNAEWLESRVVNIPSSVN